MADHARTQCRDAAVALLTNLTIGSSTVTAQPGRPGSRTLDASELPALLVYTNEEEIDPGEGSGQRGARRKVRNCQLMVAGYDADTSDLDKALDNIAKAVEAALEASPTLSGKAADCYHVGTVKEDGDAGEQPVGRITLTFTCEYHTREGVPDAPLA